jgi:hypothetical protein
VRACILGVIDLFELDKGIQMALGWFFDDAFGASDSARRLDAPMFGADMQIEG